MIPRQAALLVVLGAGLACGESGADVRAETADVIDQAAKAGDAMKDWLAMSRDEFSAKVAEQQQRLETTVADLKQRAQAATEAGKPALAKALSDLETGWSDLKTQSAELADAGAQTWEVARRDFVDAMENVEQAAKRVRDELSQGDAKTS